MKFYIMRASTKDDTLALPCPQAVAIPYHPDWDDDHPESIHYAYTVEVQTLEDLMRLTDERLIIDPQPYAAIIGQTALPSITVYDDYME